MIRTLRGLLARIPPWTWVAATVAVILWVAASVLLPDNGSDVTVEGRDTYQPHLEPVEPYDTPAADTPTQIRAAARAWTVAWLAIGAGEDPGALGALSTPAVARYAVQTQRDGVPDATIDRLRLDASGDTFGVATVRLSNDDRLTITVTLTPPSGWLVAAVGYDEAGGPT